MMLLRSLSSPPRLNYGCAARVPAVEHGGGGGHLAVLVPVSPAGQPPRQGALCRALSEGDLLAAPIPAVRAKKDDGHVLSACPSASISVEEGEEEEEEEEDVIGAAVTLRRLLTSTGLEASAGREPAALALVEGVGGGGEGGRVCGGGQGGDRGDGDSRGASDARYRRMIRADPDNSLLLGNYARFLKEVEGDVVRAQEYCERAIVANPGDGDALALYAGLVWENSRDADRADAYFSRAVQAAPDDCYVLGSYAGFLWDAEEDDEDDYKAEPPPPPFLGAAQPPSVRAAS